MARKKFIRSYTRRDVLKAGAASAIAVNFLPSRVFGANERLTMAGIGVGGKGGSDINGAGSVGEVIALCDVDFNRGGGAAQKWPKAKKFTDYRKMLDEMGKEIDGCTISTPDHNHAPAAMRAIRQGIHVYVQKPLTHTVFEARQMRLAATKHKVCTQMGNQGT
ncbi:MAG: Gfo/Idh/MocA family oxidoreductase, partial [Verrucomicrobiota bacterium]|nr:Gfo/Idh/MocA family oxidoreductase [Verrucomicrobiota bacterium]